MLPSEALLHHQLQRVSNSTPDWSKCSKFLRQGNRFRLLRVLRLVLHTCTCTRRDRCGGGGGGGLDLCAADDDDVQLSGTSHTQTYKHRGHQKNSNHQGVGGRGVGGRTWRGRGRSVGAIWRRAEVGAQALMHLGVMCSRGAAAAAVRVAGQKGERGATRLRQLVRRRRNANQRRANTRSPQKLQLHPFTLLHLRLDSFLLPSFPPRRSLTDGYVL